MTTVPILPSGKTVDAAEGAGAIVECRLDLGFLGHVAAAGRHQVFAETCFEFGFRGGERLAVPVGQHHAGAFRQQPGRRRRADAAGRAGDEGNLTVEPVHPSIPLPAGR